MRQADTHPPEKDDPSVLGSGEPLPPQAKENLAAFAYAEYHRALQEGQSPDVREWLDAFPECQTDLRKLLEIEGGLDAHMDALVHGSASQAIDWPAPGGQREGFTIVRELARGALARVYLATEAATGDRLVVLKCSLHGDAEARTMGRLSHPHVVPILSARLDQRSGLTMVCMPYLGSATLKDVLNRVRASLSLAGAAGRWKSSLFLDVLRARAQPEDAPAPVLDPLLRTRGYADGVIHLAAQLADTLAFLHARGVCHRDLKPSNVLLDPSGKPLLLDFNLSDSEREAAVPVGGTLRYMAPEQIRAYLARSKHGMDERADLYALGVMIYELLGGVHPCDDTAALALGPELARATLEGLSAGFRPFRRVCPALERPVAAVLDCCVAFDAAKRPPSAAELAAALRRQFAPARRLRRWLAARPRTVLCTLCLLAALFAALGYAWAVTPPFSAREYERGRTAYRAGDFDAAETHFDRALRAAPSDPRFRYARGCARLQQSKYLPKDKAKFDQVLDDLTSPEQGAADARSLAVNAYIQICNQNYRLAIKLYNRIESSGCSSIMVLNNRAFTYIALGRFKEAQDDLNEAVRLDPNCQAVRYNRAFLAFRMRLRGKIKAICPQSLDDVELALRLGPTTSALYRDAALLYSQAASDDQREARLEQALLYLRQAIAAGEPPTNFRLSPFLSHSLKQPTFASLTEAPPREVTRRPELRLIDPVDMVD